MTEEEAKAIAENIVCAAKISAFVTPKTQERWIVGALLAAYAKGRHSVHEEEMKAAMLERYKRGDRPDPLPASGPGK
jgi:hypothetical protein